jgi:hypothetical protein
MKMIGSKVTAVFFRMAALTFFAAHIGRWVYNFGFSRFHTAIEQSKAKEKEDGSSK